MESPAEHVTTMLDRDIYKVLSMKRFQGVWARNIRECSLKSHIGKARLYALSCGILTHYQTANIPHPGSCTVACVGLSLQPFVWKVGPQHVQKRHGGG